MRFHFAEAMIDPTMWVPLAREVEAAGFDGMTVPDSLCYPEVSDSKYPYTPDGNREFLDDKPFLDPFVQISGMGAVTEALRFTIFVLKLPVRHPVITAKLASSVAAMTGGRLDLGVGVSPWPDDYRVTGIPWAGRGKRMDECIDIMRGMWTGEYYEHQGEVFQIESIKMCPAPPTPIPVLIGGHSKAALRRAARVGDGWLHAGGDGEELERMIAELHRLRVEYGRDHLPFDVRVISMEAYMPEGVERLSSIGVTDVIVGFRNAYSRRPDTQSLEEKAEAARMFGERIIASFR